MVDVKLVANLHLFVVLSQVQPAFTLEQAVSEVHESLQSKSSAATSQVVDVGLEVNLHLSEVVSQVQPALVVEH